jgi:hypothetical protein
VCKNQKDHQKSKCCVLGRDRRIESVHDNTPPSKQVEHVVDEVVNDDELVKNVNHISLKERPAKDMEGDESTSNSSLEEEFVTP